MYTNTYIYIYIYIYTYIYLFDMYMRKNVVELCAVSGLYISNLCTYLFVIRLSILYTYINIYLYIYTS